MFPEEKKLERLNSLFELVNQDFATPDDLIQLSEAILAIITNERDRLDTVIAKNDAKGEATLQTSLRELVKRETNLTRLLEQLKSDTEQNLSGEIARTTNSLAKELKRLERKIPSKTDLSGLEGEIQALKGQLNTLPTEITLNNEAIRDGLELLQGDERLDKSAIKGLDDWEEIATLARSPKTINGAGVKLLRYLSDVNIEGITNGQTIIWNSTLSRFDAGSAGASSPLTTKGDLYTRTTVDARLAVGTDGQVLSSDSTQATGLKWIALAGGGDMLLAAVQTVSALKTYLAGTLGLRNVANTFTSFFTNTNTASRTYTLPDRSGTIADDTDLALKASKAFAIAMAAAL